MIYIDIVKQDFIMDSIKIYITNVSPSKINIEKMHENFSCSTKSKIELCSLDFGIHVVEKDAIYRIEPSFNEKYNLIKNYENYGNGVFPNGFDLLIDENVEIRVPVVSQLPSDPIIINKTIYEFKQSFKSNLSLENGKATWISFLKSVSGLLACIIDSKTILDSSSLETEF